MNYLAHVNALIKTKVAEKRPLVMFGQNIAAGSCVGGLTRGLKSGNGHHVLNTPNCENTLVGTGFGLMLSGVSSLFLMKQQDFLLLGIDQLVNSYNLIRRRKLESSFTIVNVVVDSGYEGPQSALNNFYDFCSVARVPGYSITNKHDADFIMQRHLLAPGFRIIGVSQRLAKTDLLEMSEPVSHDENGEIFQYAEGDDATIVCFNFSFPQALGLRNYLQGRNLSASLFSVNAMLPVDWTRLLQDIRRTRRVVIVDDSKSINGSYLHFIIAVQREIKSAKVLLLTREKDDRFIKPNADQFVIDHEDVVAQLGLTSGPEKKAPVEATLQKA